MDTDISVSYHCQPVPRSCSVGVAHVQSRNFGGCICCCLMWKSDHRDGLQKVALADCLVVRQPPVWLSAFNVRYMTLSAHVWQAQAVLAQYSGFRVFLISVLLSPSLSLSLWTTITNYHYCYHYHWHGHCRPRGKAEGFGSKAQHEEWDCRSCDHMDHWSYAGPCGQSSQDSRYP